MELDAAVQIARHARQTLQPAVETRLELGPRRHHHLYAPQRVERLHEAGEHYLTVQSVVQTLQELAPELGIDIGMHVHAHDDFRTSELTEGMLDAVGDVRRQAHLCLHVRVAGTGALLQAFQQLQSVLAVGSGLVVVVHHVDRHQAAVQLGVAHHDGKL